MTREQFLAYDRARQLERIIQPVNDNSETKAGEIYLVGVFDGVLGCVAVVLLFSIIYFIAG